MPQPRKFSRKLQIAVIVAAVVVLGYVILHARAAALVGDLNGDGVVNITDLSILLSDWGTSNATADINHDGVVNILDLSALLSHWGETGPTPTPTPTPTPPPTSHVMVLMMENQSYSDIIGSSSAPYMTSLSKTYQNYTDFYGIGHYSLTNYVGFWSGNYYSWATGDCDPGSGCQVNAPTLGTQLDTAGVTWKDYNESMPSACDHSNSGNYAVRHNGIPYFTSMATECKTLDVASTNMLADLNSAAPPAFAFYSPNLCHDAGGDASCGTIAAGDSYLKTEIPAIQATSWYANGGIIVLTFDEGDGSGQGAGEHLTGAGNHIPTIVISAATSGKPAVTSYGNLFGLLGGIEKKFGVPCLGQGCNSASGIVTLP